MNRNNRIRFTLVLSVASFAMPLYALAADLSFSPTSATFPPNKEFSIKVTVNPNGDSINAADGVVNFDKDVLQVVSVTKEGSAFSLWTADPSFSNSLGTVTFSGGTPSGFSKAGNILTITFKGKKAGSSTLSFTKPSVLAADGKGTNVFKNEKDGTVTIDDKVAAEPPAADPVPAAASADTVASDAPGPLPIAPSITSATHPKADSWYATSTATFTWTPTSDVLGVRMLISDKDSNTPSQLLKGIATSTIVTNIKDGVSYFLLQYKNDSGWGDIAKKKIQIDTVPPEPFDLALLAPGADKIAKFGFKAEDKLSGVERYEIMLGESVVASPSVADVGDGSYPVPPQAGGPQSVTIKAYDKAGNVRAVKKDMTLPVVAKPASKDDPAAIPPQPLWNSERIVLILFALIIGGLIAWMRFTRKAAQVEHARYLKRVAEIADKNDRVFGAMREEFEDLLNNLDEKPQLTVRERDFLENMKEVFDVSEELIDTSVEELKKLMRGV